MDASSFVTVVEVFLILIFAAMGLGIALNYAIEHVEPNSKAEAILIKIIKVLVWLAYLKP